MLIDKTIDESRHLSNRVYNATRILTPITDTPVHRLTMSVMGSNNDDSAETLKRNSVTATSIEGSHGEIEQVLVRKSARLIGNIISVARNVINPKSKEIIANIESQREMALERAIDDTGVVLQIEVSPLLTDDAFQELLFPFTNYNPGLPKSTDHIERSLADRFTQDESKELAMTGISLLDKRLVDYLGSMMDDVLYFGDMVNPNQRTLKSNIYSFMSIIGILNGKTDKAVSVISDPAVEADLQIIKAILGRTISSAVDSLLRDLKNGAVLATGSYVGRMTEYSYNKVFVLGKNYRKWIAETGGSPEAILGYHRASGGNYNLAMAEELIKNPTMYANQYARLLEQLKAEQSLQEITIVRETIARTIATMITNEDLEELEQVVLQERLQLALKSEYFGNTVLVPYVRKVLCAVYTEGTDVEMVLTEVDNALATMETPDLQQAIYRATARMVGRWIGRQMVLTKE